MYIYNIKITQKDKTMKTSEINYGEEYKLNGIVFGLIEHTETDITIEYELNGKYFLRSIENTDNMENVFPFCQTTNRPESSAKRAQRFINNYNGGRVV